MSRPQSFVGPQQSVPPFNELAKQLDPMLPKVDYDMIRQKYFVDHIVPRIQNPTATGALWEDFKAQTERQPLLTKTQQWESQLQIGINGAARQLIQPAVSFMPGMKPMLDQLNKNDEELQAIADREGFSANAPKFFGSMIGMLPPAILTSMAVEPAAAFLAGQAFTSVRTIALANRALRGGLGFAAFEAASDQTGDRLMSGLRGFATGATLDLALGLPAFLGSRGIEAPAKVAKDALLGKPLEEKASSAVAEYVNNQAATAQKEGRPNVFLFESNKTKGVTAILSDPDGRPLTIPILPGKEDAALNSLNKWLDKGGTFDTLQYHPNDAATAQKVMRELADKRAVGYDNSVFLRTQEGKAPEELVSALAEHSVPSEVKSGMVSVPVTNIEVPEPSLPPGVKHQGVQMGVDGKLAFDLYNLDIGEGKQTTFAVKEGQDILEQANKMRDKWGLTRIEAEQAKADVLTKSVAQERIDAGEMPKMSKVQAANIIRGYGGNPETADLEAVQYMGEQELNRLYETVQRQKEAQIGPAAGLAEEKFGKGNAPQAQLEFAPKSKEVDVPSPQAQVELGRSNSLYKLLGIDPETHQVVDIPLEGRPGQIRAVVPLKVMRAIGQINGGSDNFAALTWQQWQSGLQELGVSKDEIAKLAIPNSPMIVFRQGVERATVYHEGIHANLVNAELNPVEHIPEQMRSVATELVNGLRSYAGYAQMKFEGTLDEAFTYAAQAVRFNEKSLMDKLVEWDRSPDHIKMFVNETSKNLLDASYAKLDNPGVRIFQRRLEDLIRRTDTSVFYNAAEGLRATGEALSFEPQSGTFSIVSAQGQMRAFPSLNDAWDYVLQNDISDYTADPTFWGQVRGARGPFTSGPLPGKNMPLPDTPLVKENGGFGWTSINGWFRPFLPWVATLDRQVNEVAAKTNKYLPIFDAVKKVDNGVRAGEGYLNKWTTKFGDQLANFTHEKQVDLFELLSLRPDDWDKALDKFRFDETEKKAANQLLSEVKAFSQEAHIPVLTYLQDYYPKLKYSAWQPDAVPGWSLIKNARSQGFWENAVQTASLDPSDNHMGRFLKWTIKAGYEKNFTGTPLEELQKLVDLKSAEGSYVLGSTRYPLTNYIRYMKGVPDTTSQAINKAIGDFQGFLSDKAKVLNKSLPDGMKLPEEFAAPAQTMNRLMLLSYAAGLALRPAIAVRDALQVMITGFPVIGGGAFAKGMGRALTREGWQFAEQNGALLRKTTVGELYGDVFDELPLADKGNLSKITRYSQKLLGPSRWGNNFARAAVFNGTFAEALDATEAFSSGSITQDQFLKQSHAWALEPQLFTKFIARASKPGAEAATIARDIALEVTDLTQWAYRRGTQPAMLKTGLGRIFGQYGNWPLNYMEFLSMLGKKYSTFPEQSMKALGTWGAVNFAASKAMEGIGADSSKWLWTSPAGYAGGPQLDFVRDLAKGMEGGQEGESARARVLRYPINFIPGSIEARSIITAMEGHEDLQPGGKGFLRALGFRPLEQVKKDQDYQQWLLEESGITANPYRGR